MLPSVQNLAIVWASIGQLCADLTDAQWAAPTGCPGWTVQDNVAHLTDYEARALGQPGPAHDPGPRPYLKNDLGRSNEIGVDARRGRPGPAVLAEFRAVTAERLAQLGQLTTADLATGVTTPVGPGTVADLLTLRVMDSWSHEQDIRRALGRPGHTDGPAAAEAIGYLSRFLPYVVGKRAGAPDGATVLFSIGAQDPVAVEVAGGRGRITAAPGAPAVRLVIPAATFAALAGGRADVPDDVAISGDRQLGQRVLAAMNLMP